MTKCDEIVIVLDSSPTKKTNTIAKNATTIASINVHKKVRDCYILHTVLLAIILLLIITIIMQNKKV